MGGRGSSSGMSDKPYGTEYETLYQSGNIKFVRYKNGAATTPAETMTNGRVYVTVNARDKIKSITYYDKHNKHFKQIDIGHEHKVNGEKKDPHTHKGYMHDEKGTYDVSPKERKMIDRVKRRGTIIITGSSLGRRTRRNTRLRWSIRTPVEGILEMGFPFCLENRLLFLRN